MRTFRPICIALVLLVLFTGSLLAQTHLITDTPGGTVTTTPPSGTTTGVSITTSSNYPDITVTTGTTSSTSAFRIFNPDKELLRVQSNGFMGLGPVAHGTPLQTAAQVLLDLNWPNVPYGGQLRLSAPDYDQITFYNSSSPGLNASNRLATSTTILLAVF
jgi:hypothetical protein